MTQFTAVRAWVAVHATPAGLGILGVVAVLSWLFGPVSVSYLGLIGLPGPVSALLLLPAIAGVAVATGCENTARLPLPDPPRARLARMAWLVAWTTSALAAANIGQLSGSAVDAGTVSRNVLFHGALALTMSNLGSPSLAWLPSLAYMVACMVFGYPPHDTRYYWWAVIMQDRVTVTQALVIGALFLVVALRYVLRPAHRRGSR